MLPGWCILTISGISGQYDRKIIPPPHSIFQNQGKTQVLPVLPHMAPLVLVQAIYVKRISWGSLYISYTLTEKYELIKNLVNVILQSV